VCVCVCVCVGCGVCVMRLTRILKCKSAIFQQPILISIVIDVFVVVRNSRMTRIKLWYSTALETLEDADKRVKVNYLAQ